ncbi:synaptotagmin-5-like isoform X1 [Andrographis paniculata]|uniref:synaptotagmin-5-like isoform X1 n=1 Tax=Andrographis paniculata TaxID=175694 RepID=UPI0021E6F9FE|nr:synaptotagmin-5-like isoform X1 [Andrographis paniculata]
MALCRPASEIIRNSVEPILEQYRPAILASLKFSALTLGTVAPQFTGVCIVEGDGQSKEIVMELDLQWDGNPNIVLDIKTRVGVALPVQVKDIGFTGVFRLMFKPLVSEFPCFGAICYSLREKRKLDFTFKVIGGDIKAIPGISDALEDTIRDAIEDSITWPVRKIVPIIPGDYSYLEVKTVGMLDVKLIEAKELENKDIIGKSDPFAKLYVRPLRDRTRTSKVINNESHPIWNEHFEFEVEDCTTQHLTVKVYDDEGIQAAELIGCCQVALSSLEPGKVKDMWMNLVKDLDVQRGKKNIGRVHLELLYRPLSADTVFTSSFDPDFRLTSLEKALKQGASSSEKAHRRGSSSTALEKQGTSTTMASDDGVEAHRPQKSGPNNHTKKEIIHRGVLSVTVVSAEDLPATDFMGKSDPFVVLTMRKSQIKYKTRVLTDTLNPIWNQTFDFVVEDGLRELLLMEVYDHDTFGKDYMGRCVLTLTRAILEGEYSDCIHIDGTEAGKLNIHVKWTSQTIIKE